MLFSQCHHFLVRLRVPLPFAGSPRNFIIAIEGILAGLIGETGPPPRFFWGHVRAIVSNFPSALYRNAKIAIGLLLYCSQVFWRWALLKAGYSLQPRITILYYHGVEDSLRFEFARQMELLAGWANVVPADFEGVLPNNKINVAITFDDAFGPSLKTRCPSLRLARCTRRFSFLFVW